MSKPVEPKAPETKFVTASDDDKISAAVAKALAQALPAAAAEMAKAFGASMMAVEAMKKEASNKDLADAFRKKASLEEKCMVCRQSVGDGKGRGCGGPWRRNEKTGEFVTEPVLDEKGEPKYDGDGRPLTKRIEDYAQFHVQRDVYPKDPIAAEWFMGAIINGVVYQSMGPGHKIWVPRVNDIDSVLSIYTNNELIQRVGRKHVRANGGSVSATGTSNTLPTGVGFSA